jgi:hypothetical protein
VIAGFAALTVTELTLDSVSDQESSRITVTAPLHHILAVLPARLAAAIFGKPAEHEAGVVCFEVISNLHLSREMRLKVFDLQIAESVLCSADGIHLLGHGPRSGDLHLHASIGLTEVVDDLRKKSGALTQHIVVDSIAEALQPRDGCAV